MPHRVAVLAPRSFHTALLASVSALALLVHAMPADAMCLGRCSAAAGSTATTAAAMAAITSAQQAAQATQQSMNSLSRATQAIQAMQAAQTAAHNLAVSSSSTSTAGLPAVTDGLSPGGLIVDPRIGADANLWVNANLPTQSTSNGVTTVTIQQTAQRAVLTWQQFNVGKNTIVDFDQSGGNSANGNSWVALNRIDATGSPSQILGQINAQGTVLIINPNGIIFTGSSQINVHTLIASAMDINSFSNNGTNVGVFNSSGSYTQFTVNGASFLAPVNEDSGNTTFLSSGLYANGGTSLLLSTGNLAGQANWGIVVQPGASISTGVSGFDNGGYVALVGPTVNNAGNIAVNAGQIILAAGNNVVITQPAANTAATSFTVNNLQPNNTSFVYSPPVVPGGALTVNSGILAATRGNITLVGDEVEQLGVAETTTSITRAGSITVLANGSTQLTANVIFGPGSVTAILPEENGETIPTNSVSTFVAPSITIGAINMDMQSGSLIEAPGASMTVTQPSLGIPQTGRVLLESGSTIDLSGLTGVTVPISEMLYTFKVTANDVADTPLAQNLIGKSVTIDLALSGTRADGETWVGSPLFASSGAGYIGDIPQSINQLLTRGGSLNVTAGSDIVTAPNSLINVSGGWIQYGGGKVTTTQLLGADGRIYSIGSANPFIAYAGIAGQFTVDHAHWGVSEIYASGLLTGSYYQPSYIDGVSAGSVSLSAINPVLEGSIVGNIVVGTRQVQLSQLATGTGGAQLTPDQLPTGAALTISLSSVLTGSAAITDDVVLSSTAPDVLGSNFTLASTLSLPSAPGSAGVLTYSTASLSASKLGSITIKGAYQLSMDSGASLSVLPGGSITLTGVSSIDGTLTAHAGSIAITGNTPQAGAGAPPTPVVLIGPDALLDVSGLWVNDSGGAAAEASAYVNGGKVSITTVAESTYTTGVATAQGITVTSVTDVTQSIVLAPGSVIDLSSGGYVGANGGLVYGSDGLPKGNGGSLTLITYQGGFIDHGGYDPSLGGYQASTDPSKSETYQALAPTWPNEPNFASVYFGGTIYADGFNTGGTLTLQVPAIQIGGAAALTSYFSPTSVASLANATGLPASIFAPSATNAGQITLPTSFFTTSGFAKFALTSTYGSIDIPAGTTVNLEQENYLVTPAMALPPTGTPVRDFAAVGLLPLTLRQPESLSLTQLPYADGGQVTATASQNTIVLIANPTSDYAGILIGAGASIVADPQSAISLVGGGSVTVLGDIIAPAGSISIGNNGTPYSVTYQSGTLSGQPVIFYFTGGTSLAAPDVWIGANAVLDVGGTVLPALSLTSGAKALPGGTLTLSGSTIVALAGSIFDIAGASGTTDMVATSGSLLGPRSVAEPIWSNGGTLTFLDGGNPTSSSLLYPSLYFAGTIKAQGGAAEASGGTLDIGTASVSGGTATLSGGYNTTIIQQSGDVTNALNASSLAAAGKQYPVTQADLTALAPASNGTAFLTADTINGSGLDTVTLAGAVAFSGNVTVKIPDALYLYGNLTLLPAGVTNPSYAATAVSGGIPTIGATNVTLQAGYIQWLSNTKADPKLADGTLTLDASAQIDLAGVPTANNIQQLNLISGGDIRLIGEGTLYETASSSGLPTTGIGGNPSVGALLVPDNLSITAREVYPETDTAFLLISLGLAPSTAPGTINTISIASNGRAPVAPLSANGAILVDAPTIVQGGALWAPLGTIQLGFSSSETLPAIFLAGSNTNDPYNPIQNVVSITSGLFSSSQISTVTTQRVRLSSGSLTSVSAAGLDIPYGTTVDNTNWSEGSVTLSGPPAKLIALGGANVVTEAGAVINASGGGDIYATEFVPGTGGSRNVLTTTTQTVYALVPGYDSAVAVPAGTAVTIAGGNGIPAGTYALLPATYATLPGAYRVVVVSTNTGSNAAFSAVMPDGSVIMTGTLTNAITGAKSSQTSLLEIQSGAVWSKYSEIDITTGNKYFANLAASNGTAVPQLPIDAGQLSIAAATSLVLNATNNFAPAAGGRVGQADITGNNILVVANDLAQSFQSNSAYNGYLFLDADQISALGVGSVLIGGVRSQTTSGTLITATALNLEVDTDAAHPLTGPELLLVSLAPTSPSPSVHGITVDAGSVIAANGTVPASSDQALTIGVNPVAQYSSTGTLTGYSPGVSGDGSLLRVSNGTLVSVTRNYVPGIYTGPGPTPTSSSPLGSLTIGAGVSISGNSITLDSSGTNTLPASANLQGQNFDLSANIINLGGGSGGLVLSPAQIGLFAGAQTLDLRSASVFNFYGSNSFGGSGAPIGSLTFDGSGFYSDGGATTVVANNISVVDSQATANSNGANTGGAGGTLNLDATGSVAFGAGSKTWSGFAAANVSGGQDILFTGSGSLNAGSANVALTAPAVIADAGSSQSLTTTGTLTIQPAAGALPTLAATDIGGTLKLTAGNIADSGTILAQGGTLSLEATSGDLNLSGNAAIRAGGTEISLFGLLEDTPGGSVSLVSDKGNINLGVGTLVDVSAVGVGYAGTLVVEAPKGTATLNGTLQGNASFNDTGGNFALTANTLAGNLPLSGFTGSFAVELGNGDITIAAGQTLTSGNVLLVANNGSVVVNGTIDASGPTGGTIALYGAGTSSTVTDINNNTYTTITGGVTVGAGAQLLARYQADSPSDPAYANGESTLVQTGGTITLGTTGLPSGTLNSTYGYENVSAPQTITTSAGQQTIYSSGTINVAAGAVFDVSGGPGGANINNTGGTVYVRAPILTNNNIPVSFRGTVVTNAVNGAPSGNGVVAEAYAVWSTTDSCTLIAGGCNAVTTLAQFNALTPAQQAQLEAHFDGIIDPAGFFDGTGNQLITATGGLYPTSTYAAPAAGAYLPHVDFYQYTLLNFVQNPFNDPTGTTTNTNAVAADFAGAQIRIAGSTTTSALPSSMLQLQPEIDLVNPSSTINGGNITVASNWNLGAGIYNSGSGAFSLFYRTTAGAEPGILSLRAANNVQLNATISDGFYEASDPFFAVTNQSNLQDACLTDATCPSGTTTSATDLYNTRTGSSSYPNGLSAYMPGLTSISSPPTSFPSGYTQATENAWYGEYYYYYAFNLLRSLAGVDKAATSKYITTIASNFDNNPGDYASSAIYAAAYAANYANGTFDNNPSDYASTAIYNQAKTLYAGTTFDNNPNDYPSYFAYLTAYNTNYVGTRYVTGESTTSFTVALSSASNPALKKQTLTTFDNTPTDYGSYADYQFAYYSYRAAMESFLSSYYGSHKSYGANPLNPASYPSPVLAPVPPVYGEVFAGGAVETAAQYLSDYDTHYGVFSGGSASYGVYITSYNSFATEPGDLKGSTTTGSAYWLVALPYLPTTSQTPPSPTSAVGGVANNIGNNPAISNTTDNLGNAVSINDYNTTAAASLMTAAVSGKGSFSYDIVGGAFFPTNGASSVDPNAVVPVSALTGVMTGNVTINGHTSYTDAANTALTIEVPTLLRTGTGSITITAAGNFELLDTTAPGVVYTAGAATSNVSDFTAPTLLPQTTPTGLMSAPTWAANGGSVTITAGQNIVGIETPIDLDGSQTGGVGVSTGQFWSAWYFTDGASNGTASPFASSGGGVQYSAWVNYASFFQGIGALGGGNITLKAGNNIYDISASLPETIQVSGGTSSSDPPVAHYFGGGDLLVQAGANLYSSAFYVGRGSGRVTAGGVVAADPANPITGLPTQFADLYYNDFTGLPQITPFCFECVSSTPPTYNALPLILAVQDGFITVQAAGSITLGGIFEPTRIPPDLPYLNVNSPGLPTGFGVNFDSYGASSGVSLISLAGNITAASLSPGSSYTTPIVGVTDYLFHVYGPWPGLLDSDGIIPPTLDITAVADNIAIPNDLYLAPSSVGNLILAAGGSISTVAPNPSNPNNLLTYEIQMLDATSTNPALSSILGIPTPTVDASALHANDPNPAIIYAGGDITAVFDLLKPAQMEAGLDIVNTTFIGQNINPTDITSIIAGRDILAVNTPGEYGSLQNNATTITLYGPGDLLVAAGRNLGPFTTYSSGYIKQTGTTSGGGIIAAGNGSNNGNFIPYLPLAGANITALFGVGPGIDYAAAIADYVNVGAAATGGIDFRLSIAQQLDQQFGQQLAQLYAAASTNSLSELQLSQLNSELTAAGLSPLKAADLRQLSALTNAAKEGPLSQAQLGELNQINSDLAAAGITTVTPAQLTSSNVVLGVSLTSAQAVATFQALSATRQQLLVDRAFLDFLTQVSLDYNNPASAYYHQYARAYDTIATLFPAAYGYTNNNTGGSNGASVTVHTGDLTMAYSRIETQTGGDINILGPGGNIFVGSNAADPLSPAQEGILTLMGGSISTYTDGSVQIYQSRIFTEQGGNLDMFSANGDLNAGKGPKSSAAYPPLQLICDVDGYCRVNPTGLVTGAGIGALLSIPGQDPTLSNTVLTAPHGTVDASAAGIRVAGNLNIVALQVLNAFNIQVQGTITGLPTFTGPNVGALTTASNVAGASQVAVPAPTGANNKGQPSVIIVEVIGYGGGSGSGDTEAPAQPQDQQRRKDGKQGYNIQPEYNDKSAVQVAGYGTLNETEAKILTPEERQKLNQH